MKIIDWPENKIKEEFDKIKLPEYMFGRYKKYLSDLDTYYTLRNLDSPRMPQRILQRAFNMTQCFYFSILDGQSERLADYTARNFVDSINPLIEHDYIKFIGRYMFYNGITKLDDMIRELVGDDEDINSLLAGKPGKKPNSLHMAHIAHHICAFKDFDSKTLDFMAENESDEHVIRLNELPFKSLKEQIYNMTRLIYNKRLQRHVAQSTNERYVFNKVSVNIYEAERKLSLFHNIVEKYTLAVPLTFNNNINYLFCLVEAVKDVYRLY